MVVKSAKPHIAHRLIIHDDKGKKEIVLTNSSYSIGRGQKCNIFLSSRFVSRRHATLFKIMADDGRAYYRIVDGDMKGKMSVNGLRINGRKVHYHDLKDGDKIFFGSQVYAIYEHRQHDSFPTIPPDDPFDITLIDPAMIVNETEESSGKSKT